MGDCTLFYFFFFCCAVTLKMVALRSCRFLPSWTRRELVRSTSLLNTQNKVKAALITEVNV